MADDMNKKTLFLGNGFSRAICGGVPSWDEVLQWEGDKIDNNTILYEASYQNEKRIGNETAKETELRKKKGIIGKINSKRIYNADDIDLFGEMLKRRNITNIITTNYDSIIEDILVSKCHYKMSSSRYDEKIYSVRRKKTYNSPDKNHSITLWKIHGDGRDDNEMCKTLTLGLDHYCGYIAKISAYIKGQYDFPKDDNSRERIPCEKMDDKCKNGTFTDHSWIDLFFCSDMYISGFGMDYAEIDIWWLIIRRARLMMELNNKEINNRIHFLYSICYDAGKKGLFDALGAFGVECQPICTSGNYLKKLFNAIPECT